MKRIVGFLVCAFLAPGLCRAENEVKIGAMLCLTGVCAPTGTASLRGAELAVSELNAKNGILGRKVLLRVQDTREVEVASGAMTAFNNLALEPGVAVFIGPTWSNGGMSLVPVFRKRPELIAISPSLGVADFNEGSPNLFNLWPHDDISTRGLATVAMHKGWKRAAIVSAQDSWATTQAQAFAEEFKKLGGEIVITIEPLPGASDLRTEIFKVVEAKPDVVLFTLWPHMKLAAKELRQLKYAGGLMAVQMDKVGLATTNGALEGTVFAQFPESDPSFVQRFVQKYGESPALSADTSYDTVMLVARAAESAGTLAPDQLKAAMSKAEFQGASGWISLDAVRAIKRKPEFFVVRGETFARLDGEVGSNEK
ncbi:MAG: ABC transporter substrate-binding protein [Deltaproteobacteria bacterium]|nr:ABC transporter substrate-binding protein [Deltaproteobacteria bacterium]